jgi:putative transcriptional regulator
MYHYTESGLRNVWLVNGYVKHKTQYGVGVSIHDVAGLHKLIGLHLTQRTKLTGAEFRFLRKEMGMSQAALASLIGTSEQNISLWERRGRIPKSSDRLVKLLYREHVDGSVPIRKMIEGVIEQDARSSERLEFKKVSEQWREAA